MPKFQIDWEETECYKIVLEAKDEDAAWDQYFDSKYDFPDPHYSERTGATEMKEVDESIPATPYQQPLETENK